MCASWEIEHQNLGFSQMIYQGGVEGQILCFLLILVPMWFLWDNLWSVFPYIMGPFTGCSSQDGKGQHHLPFENVCKESVITQSQLSCICFQITHLTQIGNLRHWGIAYRRCNVNHQELKSLYEPYCTKSSKFVFLCMIMGLVKLFFTTGSEVKACWLLNLWYAKTILLWRMLC